ncbi:hypothetical protein DY000_02053864 [Brassica cretica]|uniref:UDP-glycosyltransferases domain-containing protein n=2 Tax=Brassica cretica TaxID=69181 RepID=A0ABQ7AIG2_BRACR|nr:hypothetical protein DY000_02053864 [Brassica cretica]
MPTTKERSVGMAIGTTRPAVVRPSVVSISGVSLRMVVDRGRGETTVVDGGRRTRKKRSYGSRSRKKRSSGGALYEKKIASIVAISHLFSSVRRTPNVSGKEDTRVSNAPQTRIDPPRIGPYPKLTNPQDPQYFGPKICKPKPAPQWDFTGQARGLSINTIFGSNKIATNDPSGAVNLPSLPQLRLRDLPTIIIPPYAYNFLVLAYQDQIESLKKEENPMILFNSSNELEQEALSSVLDNFKIVPIGPSITSRTGSGIGDEYIQWLDTKADSSVLYISFGTLAVLSKKQLTELSKALIENRRPFLWVIAEKSFRSKEDGEEKEEEGIKSFREELDEIGMVVSWCDQFSVLKHRSIGCFVTHCGWNSTLESLVAGVPVVAFPQWDDQMTNGKLLEEAWRTGVRVMEKKEDEEVVVESEEIRRCIEEVMEEKAEEYRRNAARWRDIAAETVGEGGSSFNHLKAFVDEHIYVVHINWTNQSYTIFKLRYAMVDWFSLWAVLTVSSLFCASNKDLRLKMRNLSSSSMIRPPSLLANRLFARSLCLNEARKKGGRSDDHDRQSNVGAHSGVWILDEEWRLFNHKASHAGQHPESTCLRHRKTNSKEPRGKEHAGSTTRSNELEGSSTSSRGEDDAGDPHHPLPALPKSFVRGVTRVKQRGNPSPLARRRSVDPVIKGVVDLVEAEIVSQSQPLSDDGDSTRASTNLSLLQINEMVEKAVPKRRGGRLVGLARRASSYPASSSQAPYADPMILEELHDKDERIGAFEEQNTTILSENATIRSENATILAELASQKKFNTEIMQKLDRLMSSSSS